MTSSGQFSEKTRFTVCRVSSLILGLVKTTCCVVFVVDMLLQVPTMSVMVSSVLRLMIYCGVCDSKEHRGDKDSLCHLAAASNLAAGEGGTIFI